MGSVFDMLPACPQTTRVFRAGEGISPAPAGVSNGTFDVQMLLSSCSEGEMTAMRAHMPPGIITHWHSHPRGQLLFVLNGTGHAQRMGDEAVALYAGDAVWFAPDERHWHGAAPESSFEYLSIQPVKDGKAVDWFEPVTPEAF
ncbi:cupin domain-containing protein [Thalassospira profundimaris]|nr:cupin domain-containing protein [Thalassospira profundimaris]